MYRWIRMQLVGWALDRITKMVAGDIVILAKDPRSHHYILTPIDRRELNNGYDEALNEIVKRVQQNKEKKNEDSNETT